jgi:hypothetical protein
MTLPHGITPHPSLAIPQSKPCSAQAFGVHCGAPQTLGTLTPHCSQLGQLPQMMTLPQPSPTSPHSKPCPAHVTGTHPLLLVVDVDELVPEVEVELALDVDTDVDELVLDVDADVDELLLEVERLV